MKITPIISSLYFTGGLKKNLRQGEVVLQEFKREYPYLKSSTYWRQRLDNIRSRRSLDDEKYMHTIDHYSNRIEDIRDVIFFTENPEEESKQAMKLYKFGNCGEACDAVSSILDTKGIEHKKIAFNVLLGRSLGRDHIFSVIGMKKGANVTNPAEWGNNAVVIDGWMNFALSVPDAIREYEKFFMAKHRPSPFVSDFDFFDGAKKNNNKQ